MTEQREMSNTKSETSDFGALGNGSQMPTLQQVRTEGSITITPEMFERMYLSPQNKVSGDLRRTFGNPTPIGLGGFLIAYSPLIFAILGWRGSGDLGAATVGADYFSGGLVAIIVMIMEFILGNTFPATFFGVFGAYFLSYGATLTPEFNAYLAFNPNNAQEAMESPGFLAGIAFWNLMMALFTFYCSICAIRVNAVFFGAFLFLCLTFALVSASEFVGAEAKTSFAHTLQISGGACGFVTLVLGWYLLLALMLSTVDFPFNLPVGDLSTLIPSATDLRKKRKTVPDLEKNA